MQQLRLLITSDTHAQWHSHPDHPGFSLCHTAQLMKALEQSEIPTLKFDLGDLIQGSAMATYTSQIAQDASCYARMMNTLGYNYQVIGNHEFNHGFAYQDSALDQLKAQILCANIVDQLTKKPYKGKAYDLIQVGDYKVGIIGVTTHYVPHWELPEHYQDLVFLDAFETTKHYVNELRSQVDLLIVAYHGGFEADLLTGEPLENLTGENQAYQMISQIEGIDILLTGHQHRHICQSYNQSFVIQPGYGGEYVGEVTITLNQGHLPVIKGQLHSFKECGPIQDISALEPEYSQSSKWLNEVIGRAPLETPTQDIHQARVHGHPFAEFLNYLMLKETGADFAGISLLNEHFVDFKGLINRQTLLKVYPYYNQIAVSQLKGEDLYQLMEFNLAYFYLDDKEKIQVNPSYLYPKVQHYNYDLYSGFLTEVDLRQPAGQRVQRLINEKTGQEIDRQAVYRLALTQYRAVGGGDYLMLSSDKLLQIMPIDIANLIIQGLNELEETEWRTINQNYSHLSWLHLQ